MFNDTEGITEIDNAGITLIETWWFPEPDVTYGDLAADLETRGYITEELAASWRTQAASPVANISETIQVISMETIRLEETTATFEIVYEQRSNPGEPQQTFIDFVLDGDEWKANQIR